MRCTLDFLRFDALDPDAFALGADGLLTTELGLLERYVGDPEAYWCDAQQRPELLCLDIASPTTLDSSLAAPNTSDVANSMNVYHVYENADATSTHLFGSQTLCHGRNVGDGIVDIFDVATMLAYLFQDVLYATLPEPHVVHTVDAREEVTQLCGTGATQLSYLEEYAQDSCYASEPQGYTLPDRRDDVRGGDAARRILRLDVAPCCNSTRLCLYTNDTVVLLALATDCPSCVQVVGERVSLYRAPQGVLLSADDIPPLRPGSCARQVVLGDAEVDVARSRAYAPGNRPYTVIRGDHVVARATDGSTDITLLRPVPLPGYPLRVRMRFAFAPGELPVVRLRFHCTDAPCPRQCHVLQVQTPAGSLEFGQFWDACPVTVYVSDAVRIVHADVVTRVDARLPPPLLPPPLRPPPLRPPPLLPPPLLPPPLLPPPPAASPAERTTTVLLWLVGVPIAVATCAIVSVRCTHERTRRSA